MLNTLISIDPGKSSGLTIGTYSDTEPYKRTHAFQIEGGLAGFMLNFYHWENGYGDRMFRVGLEASVEVGEESEVTVVCEKFVPRQALTLDAAEPLRVEGYLVGVGVMPDYVQGKKNPLWVAPAQQYFCGGDNLAEKKKRSRDFLREHGLYLTGKQVGCKDAHDAISSTLHAISWLRRQRHMPTIKHYFPEEG